ncbi:MAG: glycosyltransferase [Anaerolineae bacterium]|jgi:glycosyltransferase involved in cell wall biosynthesis|nr:glycosyltransferase [Anaerolineae bacterium]
MNNSPRITIAIPTYNRCQVLLECLHSLQRQHLGAFECYVLDDGGSTDGTPAAVQALAATDHRFHYVRLPESGCVVGRNTGFARGTAPILLTLDDDVELVDAGTLDFILAQFAADEQVGVLALSEYFLNDVARGHHVPLPPLTWRKILKETGLYPAGRISRWGFIGSKFHTLPYGHIHPVEHVRSSSMALRRRAFEQVGGFNPVYTAQGYGYRYETDLCVRIGRAGWKIIFAAMSPQSYHKTAERARGWQRGSIQDLTYARYTNRNNTFFFLKNYWDHPLLAPIFLLVDVLLGSSTQPGLYRLWRHFHADRDVIRACLAGKWWGWRMYWQHRRDKLVP